ncbi:MAG: hypothetical protein EZS28_017080, partial [Streblomastix strix]
AVAPANTKAVLSENSGLSELHDKKSRKKELKATKPAKAQGTQMGDMRLNISPAGRVLRNAYQQQVVTNFLQFRTGMRQQAPINPIVYSGQKKGFVQMLDAPVGWSRCVIMYQFTGRNQYQFWKRQYIPNDQNNQHREPRLRFVSTGPVAASAPTATSKQE